MLIRITNRCTMGCSHCMIDASSPNGEHMTLETFDKALKITRFLNSNVVLLSGGEPFEHPNIFTMIKKTQDSGFLAIVATNGLFVFDEAKYQAAKLSGAMFQITNDARYYPRSISRRKHKFYLPGWSFEDKIAGIFPCRRTQKAGIKATRYGPTCFNLRSATREYDILSAVTIQEVSGRVCAPSINIDGSIRAGEADTCFKIGDVNSTEDELEQVLKKMRCNRCGLIKNLDERYRSAIGEGGKECSLER